VRDRDAARGFKHDEEDIKGGETRYDRDDDATGGENETSEVKASGRREIGARNDGWNERRRERRNDGWMRTRRLTSETFANEAAKAKQVRRGVKEVVKALKKETKGVCVIAGDISPIDVITHLPVLCEEADVPYVYVHSKEELGAAGMTKRPTSVMLVLPEGTKGSVKMSSEDKKEFDEMYSKILAKVKSMSK